MGKFVGGGSTLLMSNMLLKANGEKQRKREKKNLKIITIYTLNGRS